MRKCKHRAELIIVIPGVSVYCPVCKVYNVDGVQLSPKESIKRLLALAGSKSPGADTAIKILREGE